MTTYLNFFFQFMTKNPERRLGYDNEELNIKRHQFFAPIDWAKLERREIKPEFVPDGSKLNFEKDFTEEEPTLRIVFKTFFGSDFWSMFGRSGRRMSGPFSPQTHHKLTHGRV